MAGLADLQRFTSNLPRELNAALRDMELVTLSHLIHQSSGPYSSEMLANMGHPFSKRAAAGLPREIINLQTGLFRDSWDTTGVQQVGDRLAVQISNSAPYAADLEHGTKYMWSRPIVPSVVRQVSPLFEKRFERAFKDAQK